MGGGVGKIRKCNKRGLISGGKSKKFTFSLSQLSLIFKDTLKKRRTILYMINKLKKETQELEIKLKNNRFLNPYCSF